MNENWSKYVQGINALYFSRKLRFDDMFSDQFMNAFQIDREKKDQNP